MSAFTTKFDAYLSTSRQSILDARAAHALRLAQHTEATGAATGQIAGLQDALAGQAAVEAAQDAEAREMAAAVEELRGERDGRAGRVDEARERLEGVRARVARGRRDRRERGEYLMGQRERNGEEMAAWEGVLGMRVEGEGEGGEERVRFVFGGRGEREVSFVLDLSGRAGRVYEVVETKPKVEARRVEEAVGEMEKGEELGKFLAAMRALLLGR